MSDWFSTAIAMQREVLRAQKAQLKTAQNVIDTMGTLTDAADATRKAGDANMRAMRSWAEIWGWKP